jgi:hypothetical protein
MEQYKISQNPGGPSSPAPVNSGKKPAKAPKPPKRGKRKTYVPKQRQTRSLDPQLVLGGAVVALLLIFAGVAWAAHLSKSKAPAVNGGAAATKKTAGGSGKVIPGETYNAVTSAIGDKKPNALNKYYAKSVHVFIRGHNINQTVTGSQAGALVNDYINGAQTPWNWHVSASDLSAWQTGPYGQYFTGNDIVGISNDGLVISITIDDNGQITGIFIAPVGDLTTPGSGGSTSGGGTDNSGGNGGSGGTSTTPATPNQDSD